jgi:hypothetical protein
MIDGHAHRAQQETLSAEAVDLAVRGDLLDTVVARIGDIESAIGVHGDADRTTEIPQVCAEGADRLGHTEGHTGNGSFCEALFGDYRPPSDVTADLEISKAALAHRRELRRR